ncbi:hypothetical protein EYF80_056923 [Liparis tanakae]|uniref:Uncharacterized protein n=1 Tax=Liparis tanakae TaxID=230148 RepID=A0A4Z2EXD3_9TELE|nr:hypothetical protein EYF80_056923 [Liparis tanakae]
MSLHPGGVLGSHCRYVSAGVKHNYGDKRLDDAGRGRRRGGAASSVEVDSQHSHRNTNTNDGETTANGTSCLSKA